MNPDPPVINTFMVAPSGRLARYRGWGPASAGARFSPRVEALPRCLEVASDDQTRDTAPVARVERDTPTTTGTMGHIPFRRIDELRSGPPESQALREAADDRSRGRAGDGGQDHGRCPREYRAHVPTHWRRVSWSGPAGGQGFPSLSATRPCVA